MTDMDDLEKALGDIGSIRREMARSSSSAAMARRRSPQPVCWRWPLRGAQGRWLPDAGRHLQAYLALGFDRRAFVRADRHADVSAHTAHALRAFRRNAAAGGGAVSAGVGRRASADARVVRCTRRPSLWMLPGLWQVSSAWESSPRAVSCRARWRGGCVVSADGAGLPCARRRSRARAVDDGPRLRRRPDARGGCAFVFYTGGSR